MATDPRAEDGFSLMEVVIALGLLAFVLAGMAYGVTNALADVGMSKQRETAVAMANQLLEEARALPYDQLTMSATDLAGDPNLAVAGGATTFKGLAVISGPSAPALLAPHRTTVVPGGGPTTFARRIYVTAAPGSTTSKLLTVQVAWSPATGGGQPLVELQTIATPYGCEAQEGTGPCDPYWYGTADGRPARIQVTGTVGAATVDATLTLDFHHAQLTTEQYTTASADAATIGGHISGVDVAGANVAATADDSISTPVAEYQSVPNVGPTAAAQSGSPVRLSMTAGGTAGAVGAARAAGQLPAVGGGALPNNGLGYSRARSSLGTGASTVVLTLPNGSTVNLFDVAQHGTAGEAVARRDAGTDPGVLDDDTVQATVNRTLPQVRLLGLPSGWSASGWTGYLATVGSWSGAATTSAGPGDTPTTTATSSGSLSWWTGTGYVSRSFSGTSADMPVNYTATSGGCTVTMTGTLTAGGRVTSSTTGSSVSGRAEVQAPVSGRIRYQHVCGATVTDLNIDIDLGRVIAESRYATPGA